MVQFTPGLWTECNVYTAGDSNAGQLLSSLSNEKFLTSPLSLTGISFADRTLIHLPALLQLSSGRYIVRLMVKCSKLLTPGVQRDLSSVNGA